MVVNPRPGIALQVGQDGGSEDATHAAAVDRQNRETIVARDLLHATSGTLVLQIGQEYYYTETT